MKKLFFILVILLSSNAMAHKYYFGFAEVEYNAISKKIEASIQLTGHDFEDAIQKEKGIDLQLEKLSDKDKQSISVYINEQFKFSNSEETTYFHLLGVEIDLTGTVTFYLESDPIDLFETATCEFRILMNVFNEQQNKMTFIYKGRKTTYAFLAHEPKRTIDLKLEQ